MMLTPDQARTRLAAARRLLDLPVKLAHKRDGWDVEAMQTMALLEVIRLLEDALA